LATLGSRNAVAGRSYGLDFWGRLLVWTLEPPPRFRFAAPAGFKPVELGALDAIVPTFLDHQRRFLDVLDAAVGKPLDAVRIVSPFDPRGRLRYRV
jgi:hypothetical protein